MIDGLTRHAQMSPTDKTWDTCINIRAYLPFNPAHLHDTHTHKHTHIHTYTHTHTRTHTHRHTHTDTTQIRTHTRKHIHIHTQLLYVLLCRITNHTSTNSTSRLVPVVLVKASLSMSIWVVSLPDKCCIHTGLI